VDLPTTPGFAGRFRVMLTLRSPLADPGGPPGLHLFAAVPFDDAASPAGGYSASSPGGPLPGLGAPALG